MLGGREKVGSEVVDIASPQLPPAKSKRLTFPFGPESTDIDGRETLHEHNIREIPLTGGALGCALWDGGVVLTRWIYANGGIFNGSSVLELGCGVGLGGIMAAHWARKVVLTDYVPQALENAAYNVHLNSITRSEVPSNLLNDEGLASVSGGTYSFEIAERVTTAMLDWDAVALEEKQQQHQQRQEGRNDHHAKNDNVSVDDDDITDDVRGTEHPPQYCTRIANGPKFHLQRWAHCATCWSDVSSGCCMPCAQKCHVGHKLVMSEEEEMFRCDCKAECKAQPMLQWQAESFDILLGAELTYNLLSCASLATVVDKFLSPSGVFYEVLSKDRDGVSVFIEEIEKRGFITARHDAPAALLGNFGTRKWSKQQAETYSLFTWRRKAFAEESLRRFPDMV